MYTHSHTGISISSLFVLGRRAATQMPKRIIQQNFHITHTITTPDLPTCTRSAAGLATNAAGAATAWHQSINQIFIVA